MQRRQFIKRLVCLGGVMGGLPLTGCGTILHSERIHQHHSRDIDWKIAALDGLGLALFFVPGVIAFAVDFYSGAIYLPPEGHAAYPVGQAPNTGEAAAPVATAGSKGIKSGRQLIAWQPIAVPRSELGPARIDALVSERIGKRFSVLESPTRVSRLSGMATFAEQCDRHLRDVEFGRSARAFFGLPA